MPRRLTLDERRTDGHEKKPFPITRDEAQKVVNGEIDGTTKRVVVPEATDPKGRTVPGHGIVMLVGDTLYIGTSQNSRLTNPPPKPPKGKGGRG